MKWAALLLALALPVSADQASWYGEELRGRLMANGHPFDPEALTAASWFYPLGARLRVSCAGRACSVVVTDRGPARRLVAQGRVIDLSAAAFRQLAPLRTGVVNVTIERL